MAFVRGEGLGLFDENGNKYMDAISGIGVCNLGHCHPAVSRTLAEQAGQKKTRFNAAVWRVRFFHRTLKLPFLQALTP